MKDKRRSKVSPSRKSKQQVELPTVAVFLCTYQGEEFLAEQLESIKAQEGCDTKIWASDDGSTDKTLDILKKYQADWGSENFKILSGPRKGFAHNFFSLVHLKEVDADYFACADQDDIWQPDKLARALRFFANHKSGIPALYCTRTKLIDEFGKEIGFSPLFKKLPSFNNALVQSIAGGNTMVMNRESRDLLRKTPKDKPIPSHDWWMYVLISGAGGEVHYDPYPSLLYRQHSGNIIGSNTSLWSKFVRIKWLLAGRFERWNDDNVDLIQPVYSLLSAENKEIFNIFKDARKAWLLSRVYGIWKSKVYRQTLSGNVGLFVATILRRI